MKIYIIRTIKNIVIFLLQLSLIAILIFNFLINSFNFFNTLKNNYQHYLYIRGFENYGIETIAEQIPYKMNYYQYVVNGQNFYYKSDDTIDKTVKIYYDILEPNEVIKSEELEEIDSFYSDIFRGLSEVYIKLVIMTFSISIMWFLLDKIKYSKMIWKMYC